MPIPLRGEVWLIDLGMAGKTRPTLIVSVAFGGQDRALISVVPHTTSLLGSPFEIAARVPFLKRADAPGIAFRLQTRPDLCPADRVHFAASKIVIPAVQHFVSPPVRRSNLPRHPVATRPQGARCRACNVPASPELRG
jgi:hypothetical protein